MSARGAYYNERDPYAAQWLRNLIAAGHIAPGEVDERSITDVSADELSGFAQCHFFAGIGVWGYALRRAGWPDERPVWTGSCPCQPFSAAGKQKGFDDERHLWPVWHRLIKERRPPIVLGEQVASALDWLDLVSADMEASGYAFGASDLCAAGFGGAHIRQRLYFAGVADARDDGRHQGRECLTPAGHDGAFGNSPSIGLAHLSGSGLEGQTERPAAGSWSQGAAAERAGCHGGLADTDGAGAQCRAGDDGEAARLSQAERQPVERADVPERGGADHGGCGNGGSDGVSSHTPRPHAPHLGGEPADWLYCRDGKWRPVEPGTFPLAHEAPARVGRLRAYGNALDAETAAQFVGAVMEALSDLRAGGDA